MSTSLPYAPSSSPPAAEPGRPHFVAVLPAPLPAGTLLRPDAAPAVVAADLRAAWLRWCELFRDPDVWSDPDKLQAMLRARLDYQDAVLG